VAGRCSGAVLALAMLAAASNLEAQSSGAIHVPSGGGRTLGPHTFVPSAVVPSPFVGTSFGMAMGGMVAVGIIEAVIVDVGGVQDTLIPSGDLAFGSLQFAYQQHLARRFAVRGSASVNVRTGTSARMLFAEGLSGITAFSLGGMASLFRDERHMLTATLDLRRNNLTELTPKDFAEYVGQWGIDSLDHWGEHLLHDRRSGRAVAGVRGAWTLRPWLGVTGMIEGGPANLYEAGSIFATTLGVGGSIDFAKLKHAVPIGLSLGWGHTSAPSRSDDIFGSTAVVGLGVYYTARPEFAIGIDLQSSTTKLVETGQSVHASGGRFALRYDF
jgi:hypothetical protein